MSNEGHDSEILSEGQESPEVCRSCEGYESCYNDILNECQIELLECVPVEHPVAREEFQQLVFSCPEAEEMRRWPRYSIAWRQRGSLKLYIYRPDLTGRDRVRDFTTDDFRAYLDYHLDYQCRNPDIGNASTWGPCVSITLPVCRLVTKNDGKRDLVFDPTGESRVEWTWEVFNLDSSQPNWRAYLERTLMIFPIEYLRAVWFQSIYLDFRVGTSRLGPSASVGSGGANWVLGVNPSADRNKLTAICMTYAALNRLWFSHRSVNPPQATDDQIDASFSDQNHQASTIYHEFGHAYHFSSSRQGDDLPGQSDYEQERPYMRHVVQNSRATLNNLWDRHRVAIGYATGGGLSQGPGEGFAEAFRFRMQGKFVGGDIQSEVEDVLDEMMPTCESVVKAREAINRFLGG